MAQYELLLPKMGESVAEATVIKWLKQPGDMISLDDTLLEIATDKVDSEVPSPVAGKLIKQLFGEDEVVQVGAVIALIETEAAASNTVAVAEEQVVPVVEAAAAPVPEENIPGTALLNDKVTPSEKETITDADRFYSPLVRSIAAQEKISTDELKGISGSGAEGRLTKDDLLNYIQNNRKGNAPVQEATAGSPVVSKAAAPIAAAAPVSSAPAVSVSGGDEIMEMDRMGKLI